jgi:hypothetical protein
MKRLNDVTTRAYSRTELLLAASMGWMIKWLADAARTGRRQSAKGLPGQATLEWVLIGGVLVVIIVGLLLTVFKPQLEAIMRNILQMVQTNTSAGTGTGS